MPRNTRATFKPLRSVPPEVPRREREAARTGYRLYRGRNGFEAAVAEHVVERLRHWCETEAPLEAYGLLVGHVFQDGDGHHVVVVGVVPDPGAKAGPFSVETTPDSEVRTRMSAAVVYPDCTILGWVHTHPRLGARYSSVDRDNQATWTAPHALGIVVDAWDPVVLAAYRGPESELLRPVTQRARASGAAQGAPPSKASVSAERRSPRLRQMAAQARSLFMYLALVIAAIFASLALWRTGALVERMTDLEASARRDRGAADVLANTRTPRDVLPQAPQVCEDSDRGDAPP